MLTSLPALSFPSLTSRNPAFLPMTFRAKEETGMWEREAKALPSEGSSSGERHPGSKAGSAGKPQASHLPSLRLGFPSLKWTVGLDGCFCLFNDLGSPMPILGGWVGEKGPD